MLAEVGLDLLVRGFALFVDGDGTNRDVGAAPRGPVDAALDIFGLARVDPVALGRHQQDAGVIERDGVRGVVGDDDADGQEVVLEVVDAQGLGLGSAIVGVGRDRDAGLRDVCGVLGGGARGLQFGFGKQREGQRKQKGNEEQAGHGRCPNGRARTHYDRETPWTHPLQSLAQSLARLPARC